MSFESGFAISFIFCFLQFIDHCFILRFRSPLSYNARQLYSKVNTDESFEYCGSNNFIRPWYSNIDRFFGLVLCAALGWGYILIALYGLISLVFNPPPKENREARWRLKNIKMLPREVAENLAILNAFSAERRKEYMEDLLAQIELVEKRD